MPLFESIPARVEAIQWTGKNDTAMRAMYGDKVAVIIDPTEGPQLRLLAGKDGSQEWVPVPVGHWVVHQPGDYSDIWPVDPEYFASKYREA